MTTADTLSGKHVGHRLQARRLELDLTIESIAEHTMMRTETLRHIEAGNFAALPEPVFIRGYLRKYAQALDLSGDDIIAAYNAREEAIAAAAAAAAVAAATPAAMPGSTASAPVASPASTEKAPASRPQTIVDDATDTGASSMTDTSRPGVGRRILALLAAIPGKPVILVFLLALLAHRMLPHTATSTEATSAHVAESSEAQDTVAPTATGTAAGAETAPVDPASDPSAAEAIALAEMDAAPAPEPAQSTTMPVPAAVPAPPASTAEPAVAATPPAPAPAPASAPAPVAPVATKTAASQPAASPARKPGNAGRMLVASGITHVTATDATGLVVFNGLVRPGEDVRLGGRPPYTLDAARSGQVRLR